jgi:hypothetical protein
MDDDKVPKWYLPWFYGLMIGLVVILAGLFAIALFVPNK